MNFHSVAFGKLSCAEGFIYNFGLGVFHFMCKTVLYLVIIAWIL